MKLHNAKQPCDQAAAGGFAIPALNNNGGSYEIGRAIVEAAEELQSPLIIQRYEPNLEYRGFDFALVSQLRAAAEAPLVLHGTSGVSMPDIAKSVKAGMTKINFGEGLRMNYIRYYNEFSRTLHHEQHTWRIDRAAKDRPKEDVREIIRAVGSEGKASAIK